MTIAWRKEMSVDGGPIDDDHRFLIALVNEFAAVDVSASCPQYLNVILEDLFQYTKSHFAREEKLQAAVQYPYSDAHHHEHLDLIRTLTLLQERLLAAGTDNGAVQQVQTQIGVLLHDWLIEHIIKSDLRMKPYAASMAEHVPSLIPPPKRTRAGA